MSKCLQYAGKNRCRIEAVKCPSYDPKTKECKSKGETDAHATDKPEPVYNERGNW